ncbi:VOC family protein [Streptomyces sp. NPDC058045]|uniref:VOC family protein n=1 Tax=Streptomyces sp. NPDC058045 TaxID=3346311 RepID=UPI0036F08645
MAATSNITGLGVVLGSTEPDGLVEWYRAALEPLGARWESHMLMIGKETIIGFDGRDDVAEKAAEPGRHLVNLMVRDMRAVEQHLNTLNVTWVRPVDAVEGGWIFATILDPVGNYLQFVQGPADEG